MILYHAAKSPCNSRMQRATSAHFQSKVSCFCHAQDPWRQRVSEHDPRDGQRQHIPEHITRRARSWAPLFISRKNTTVADTPCCCPPRRRQALPEVPFLRLLRGIFLAVQEGRGGEGLGCDFWMQQGGCRVSGWGLLEAEPSA